MWAPSVWQLATNGCDTAGQVVKTCSALVQDILKGSGKLVDNHTVKYSLPGEAFHRPTAPFGMGRTMTCMVYILLLFCAIIRLGASQHNNYLLPGCVCLHICFVATLQGASTQQNWACDPN